MCCKHALLFLGTLGLGVEITCRLSSSQPNWGVWNFCRFAFFDVIIPCFEPLNVLVGQQDEEYVCDEVFNVLARLKGF